MRNRTKFKVRFYLLPTVLLAAFVILLAAVTVSTLVAKFESMARDSAQTLFMQVAQRNADPLQATLQAARNMVAQHARRSPQLMFDENGLDRNVLVPTLITALRAAPQIYSFYYALRSEEFLQVIGVRGEAGIAAALQAPPDTYFAVRYLTGALPGAARRESWLFLDEDELAVGHHAGPALYLPTTRPWYAAAVASPGLQVSDPYVYDSLRDLGLTLSQKLERGEGVFGADLALRGLGAFAAASLAGLDGGLIITGPGGQVLASHAEDRYFGEPVQVLAPVGELDNPYFAQVHRLLSQDNGSRVVRVQGENLAYANQAVPITPSQALHVVAFSPMSLYAGRIEQARDDILLFAALTLLVCMPLVYLIARRIAATLRALTQESQRIQRLDFSGTEPVRSVFYEIDLLGRAQHTMKMALRERTAALDEAMSRLGSLVENGVQLVSRRTREEVVRQTAEGARLLSGARTGQFWLFEEGGVLRLASWSGMAGPASPGAARLRLPDGLGSAAAGPFASVARPQAWPGGQRPDPVAWVAATRRTLSLQAQDEGFDLAMQQGLLGEAPQVLLAVPVVSSASRLIGVLVLAGEAGQPTAPAAPPCRRVHGALPYVQTLAAQSGSALENIELARRQRELMEALIRLIAGAIDAKSAHTGGHCERVPELARMLAEEACRADEGPLAQFRFQSEQEWAEFRIGTWLHDCGKVTTPEHVVEKATKLETLYNRIHEIRTRFEVLLRDARIQELEAVAGGADPQAARGRFEARRAQLLEDFAFVAECNLGSERMPPACRERLARIGAQTWLRHFDDRLGLSPDEEWRLAGTPAPALPAVEPLLADKPVHIVPRTDQQRYDPRHGFRMPVPENLYNFGELYNLGIERGTLTPEERYKINEHIVQTIVMLEALPLPPELARVPEYAGTHHETLIGTGYPRGLDANDLSIPARIMAIADIFEALTASDRPYKKAKKLSEAVRLLAGFKRRRHIDGDLFDLFLTSGVYRRYAERYMDPAQIDEVDIAPYLGPSAGR
ncbi:HD domain-containing phosphohydrolase [Orrella sp. JC864]|uniref:HD domain-containing phosphohydrolase n=1 Tax=Orrella sp. JC864 TaxID=3120298 RepID=UPI00300B8FF5